MIASNDSFHRHNQLKQYKILFLNEIYSYIFQYHFDGKFNSKASTSVPVSDKYLYTSFKIHVSLIQIQFK